MSIHGRLYWKGFYYYTETHSFSFLPGNMLKILQKRKPNDVVLKSQLDTCSFHTAMKFSLKFAQWFSFFPININTSTNYEILKFKWLYWRVVYSIVTFSVFVFEFALVIYQTVSKELTLTSVSKYIKNLIILVNISHWSTITVFLVNRNY